MSRFFKYYFTILLGLFIFSIYIFFRFFRERSPREIPFTLSVLGFFILIELCLIYGYIIFRYIKPAEKSNEILGIIIAHLFKPLDDFDNFIKKLPLIKIYYPKSIIWFASNLEYIFKTPIFELIFFFFPRFVLITTFMVDIFYFHKLFYIYKVLLLGVLLFLRRYILYSIKKFKLEFLKELQFYIKCVVTKYEFGVDPSEWPENYDPDEDDDEIPPTMALPLDIFINYYSKNKIYNNFEPSQKFLGMTENFYDKYKVAIIKERTNSGFIKFITNVNSEAYINENLYKKQLELDFKNLLQVYVFHEYYNKVVNNNVYIKYFKLIIFSLYLICWIYILITSFHTLNLVDLIKVLNKTWSNVENPF